MVFAFYECINIGVLIAQIVPRRARGRPRRVYSWSDMTASPKTVGAAWYLHDITQEISNTSRKANALTLCRLKGR